MEARLSSPTDIRGFRTEAQQLLGQRVPPDDVTWSMPSAAGCVSLGVQALDKLQGRGPARSTSSIIPASFVRLCEYVAQHRDPDRFALLYRLLWRLVHEPDLRHEPNDPDMARAQHMAHAVRRDIHKLKTHVQFREVQDPQRPGDPIHIAWCEPAHHITDWVAPLLARRHSGIRWALLTPERSVYWDRAKLHFADGNGASLSHTAGDEDWLAHWRAQFG